MREEAEASVSDMIGPEVEAPPREGRKVESLYAFRPFRPERGSAIDTRSPLWDFPGGKILNLQFVLSGLANGYAVPLEGLLDPAGRLLILEPVLEGASRDACALKKLRIG